MEDEWRLIDDDSFKKSIKDNSYPVFDTCHYWNKCIMIIKKFNFRYSSRKELFDRANG
jgi:hypothetical protein